MCVTVCVCVREREFCSGMVVLKERERPPCKAYSRDHMSRMTSTQAISMQPPQMNTEAQENHHGTTSVTKKSFLKFTD